MNGEIKKHTAFDRTALVESIKQAVGGGQLVQTVVGGLSSCWLARVQVLLEGEWRVQPTQSSGTAYLCSPFGRFHRLRMVYKCSTSS